MADTIIRSDAVPNVSHTGRQTRPAYWQPFAAGGIGYMPRRVMLGGLNAPGDLMTTQALVSFGETHLFRLFEALLDIHPGLKQAKSNALRLAFGEGKTRFVASVESTSGAGDYRRDDALTSEIDALFASQPNDTGGLVGLQSALAIYALTPGMPCLEAVPGKRLQGLARLIPVDPLTIILGRPGGDINADLRAFQRTTQGYTPPLDPLTFRWHAVDAVPSNPYGVGLFSAAFGQGLADLAMNQNLRDAVRNAAWPRIAYQYAVTRIYDYATDKLFLQGDKLAEYLTEQIGAIKAEIAGMNPDDNPVFSEDITAEPIPAGNFSGLSEVLQMERHRFVQSVDELPTLMGINDGSTQTYSSTEWGVRAEKAQWLRDVVNSLLVWALNLHFRLMGVACKVHAECEPIRTSDSLVDANTRAVQQKTEAAITNRGLQTLEDESLSMTGNGLPKEEAAQKRQQRAQEGNAPLSSEDTTGDAQETPDAQKQAAGAAKTDGKGS